MERFLKRKAAPAGEEATAKRPHLDAEDSLATDAVAACGDPRTLISWNCNGLVPQLKNSWSEIQAFLEREKPDLMCLQEVRMPAAGPRGCKRGDGQRRRRDKAKADTAQDIADWQLVEKTLLAAVGGSYTVYWSLADWKYAGTALLLRKPLRPSRVSYTLPMLSAPGGHAAHRDRADANWHPEGRIILAAFESFDVLTTYAPNNGNDPASFARRAAWDAAILEELSARKRPMVWTGDLNATREEADVTHPEWFMKQCYQGEPEDMRGQPGFTHGERRRFAEILKEARLVDAYRHLHPATKPPPAGGPHYTWRGHPPVHQPVAKYHGRGMRIDFSLVAEELLPAVEEAAILGHGEGRIGFLGSDHCPIRLKLQLPATLEAMKPRRSRLPFSRIAAGRPPSHAGSADPAEPGQGDSTDPAASEPPAGRTQVLIDLG